MEEKKPLALKNELLYQERKLRDTIKVLGKNPAVCAIYEEWLQFVLSLIKICEKRNRF